MLTFRAAPKLERIDGQPQAHTGAIRYYGPGDNMPVTRLTLLTFCALLAIAASSAAQATADAPAPQTTLEIQGEYGAYYWVVETAADGSRKGGWVSKQTPLDRVDRTTLQPIPPRRPEQTIVSPQPVAPEPSAPLRDAERRRPQPADAPQTRLHIREGFWFNAGMGIGFAGCEGCIGRDPGASGGLSLGTTIGEKVLIGVGTSGWYRSYDNGVTVGGSTTDVRVRFYPSREAGFFITGGLGLGTVRVGLGNFSETEYGVGSVFGIGWDIRLRRNLSLTPFYNGFAVQTSYDQGYVDQFGIGITIH